MYLYHGSNVVVKNPEIRQSNRALDFGTGFYLTSNFDQAKKWADVITLRRGEGTAFVSSYLFNENETMNLNCLTFLEPNEDWLKFVVAFRTGKNIDVDYDLIIGPVANDNTMPVINMFINGDYSVDEAIKRLKTQKLSNQYVFKTEKSLTLLSFEKVLT